LKPVGQHNFDEWPSVDVTAVLDFHEGEDSDLCGTLSGKSIREKISNSLMGVPLQDQLLCRL
jgi:hypothetical protein